VPVLDRPVMAHIVNLLNSQGFDDLIANLHYFPNSIKNYFGDELTWSYEEELLGTAGGVRNVADFFGDDPIVVISGDALTDIDLRKLVERHESAGGIGTLAVKKVPDTREYGVVIHDADGRIQGFQEKPDPAEALSDLASCMIYVLEPEIFDYFPDRPVVDFALDVFPALLENDVAFCVHQIDAYWNDVGSLPEYIQGNLDTLEGAVEVEPRGRLLEPSGGESAVEAGEPGVDGPVLVGDGVEIAGDARLDGPLVVGDGCGIGSGARVKHSVLLPGARVPEGAMVAGAIYGQAGALG
jgi:mannose-1-phosphate guanylyltransferase